MIRLLFWILRKKFKKEIDIDVHRYRYDHTWYIDIYMVGIRARPLILSVRFQRGNISFYCRPWKAWTACIDRETFLDLYEDAKKVDQETDQLMKEIDEYYGGRNIITDLGKHLLSH